MGRHLVSRGRLIGAAVVALVIVIVLVGVFVVRPGPLARSHASATNVPSAGGPCASAPLSDATITGGHLGQFVIQPLYGDVLRYARDAAQQPVGTRGTIWMRDVVGDPALSVLHYSFYYEVTAAGWQPMLLRADPAAFACVAADMQHAGVEHLTLDALSAASQVLPGPSSIAVYIIPTTGITATSALWPTYTMTGDSFSDQIYLDGWEPDPLDRTALHDAVASHWSYSVPWAADHEYFEVVRYADIGLKVAYQSLLAHLVTDGMAESFAASQTGRDSFADHLLTPQQEQSLWQSIVPTMRQLSTQDQQSAVMFGDGAQIPVDAGYSIGYHMVQDYLSRHPGTSWAALAALSADSVLAGSGYAG